MWETVKLGDICELVYGKALDESERVEIDGFPAYGANGVKTFSNKALYEKPSIVIGRKGSAGEINKVSEPFWALDVTYFVKIDESSIDLDFLFYSLTTLNLPSMARGVKPGINRNDVYEKQIQLPPLTEQQRIVEKLDRAFEEIDRAIEATKKRRHEADKLFDCLLSDLISVKREDCAIFTLDKIAKFLDYRGKTPTKSESGVRLLTAKNVRMGFIKKEPEEFISDSEYKKHMIRGFPAKGDVVLTTEAPMGFVAQIEDDSVALGQRLITLKIFRSGVSSDFLKYALMSKDSQDQFEKKGTGATVKGIKASLLKEVVIAVPPSIEEQDEVVSKLIAAEESCAEIHSSCSKQIALLGNLKSAILAQVLKGPES
jgi:type I restriction enzyme S subunit